MFKKSCKSLPFSKLLNVIQLRSLKSYPQARGIRKGFYGGVAALLSGNHLSTFALLYDGARIKLEIMPVVKPGTFEVIVQADIEILQMLS